MNCLALLVSRRAGLILSTFQRDTLFECLVGLLALFFFTGPTFADDYILDPAPTETIGFNVEPYLSPKDPRVCSIYLKNLRYFARRNLPMSCGQPIAPMLSQKIQKAEWENLDPDQYPALFKAVVKEADAGRRDPSDKAIEWWRGKVKSHEVVFRRLKRDLVGRPSDVRGNPPPTPETHFSIVQYGDDVTNERNPSSAWRCQDSRGRVMGSVLQDQLKLFAVTNDLQHLYAPVGDWRDDTSQALWLINGNLYAERYLEDGTVKLSQFDADSRNVQFSFSPVCLFHYKPTSHKE